MEDKKEIEQLIEKSFLNGALNRLNVADMQKGFHPDFAILIPQHNDLFKLPLSLWMNAVEEYKSNPEKLKSKLRNVSYNLDIIGLVGKAAVAKVELFRDDVQISTDFISLLKFNDGWKAVAKVSNEHVINPFNL